MKTAMIKSATDRSSRDPYVTEDEIITILKEDTSDDDQASLYNQAIGLVREARYKKTQDNVTVLAITVS